jgi:hypothetical protein
VERRAVELMARGAGASLQSTAANAAGQMRANVLSRFMVVLI